jgi:hypothetical protein
VNGTELLKADFFLRIKTVHRRIRRMLVNIKEDWSSSAIVVALS